MFKNSLFIILAIIFLAGCGMKETTTQYRDKAYIKINKSANSTYKVVVDDENEFEVAGDSKDTLFAIGSGTKYIKIYDNMNNIVYTSKNFIGSNSTLEINLK